MVGVIAVRGDHTGGGAGCGRRRHGAVEEVVGDHGLRPGHALRGGELVILTVVGEVQCVRGVIGRR